MIKSFLFVQNFLFSLIRKKGWKVNIPIRPILNGVKKIGNHVDMITIIETNYIMNRKQRFCYPIDKKNTGFENWKCLLHEHKQQ